MAEVKTPADAAPENPANKLAQLSALEESFERIPMTLPQNKLAVGGIPGYYLQWMLGKPDRIAQARAAGFTFVKKGEVRMRALLPGDDPFAGSGSDLGDMVSIVAGGGETDVKGQAVRLYLMKQKIEHYQEDRAIAQAGADRVADTLMAAFNSVTVGGQAQGETGEDMRLRYVDRARTRVPDLFRRKT